MELKIRRYVTAVVDDNPESGNHTRYSLEVEDKGGAKNIPNLGEFDLIREIITTLLEE